MINAERRSERRLARDGPRPPGDPMIKLSGPPGGAQPPATKITQHAGARRRERVKDLEKK